MQLIIEIYEIPVLIYNRLQVLTEGDIRYLLCRAVRLYSRVAGYHNFRRIYRPHLHSS
jgi:hypothetical protein